MTDLGAIIFSVALLASVLCALWFKGREGEDALPDTLKKIADMALSLILEAERAYGAGTGAFKKSFVVEAILNGAFFSGLPPGVRRLLTAEAIGGVIDAVCGDVFKKQQESNPNIGRILEGGGQ